MAIPLTHFKARIGPKPDTLIITGKCVVTGEEYSVTAPVNGVARWQRGEMIQNALPELSADDREFLVSGIAPPYFDELFEEE